MKSSSTNSPLDLAEVAEIAQDFKLFQTRNSKAYVAMMADIVSALNNTPIGHMIGLDVDELKNQTGHLLYYKLKSTPNPIPCDIEYVPQLYSHLRRPSVLVLKRVQKYLMAGHRRVLARLEREHSVEKIHDDTLYDVSKKIKGSLNQVNNFLDMAKMVKGGGRKLDILMQALLLQSQTRFSLLIVDRMMRDQNDPRHEKILAWLNRSKFKGNKIAYHGLINNGFQLLDSACARISSLMEELSGLQIAPDGTTVDLERNWYALGSALPRGDDFVKKFTAEDDVDSRIKRLTFPMVRVGWDGERIRGNMNKLLVDINNPKELAAKLSGLFFDIEKRIEGSTKPGGEVQNAIESDFKLGMLSEAERDKARQWCKENKIRLMEAMTDTYNALVELKEKNPNLPLSEHLEETLKRVQSGLKGDREEQLKSLEADMKQITSKDLAAQLDELEGGLSEPTDKILQGLCDAREEIMKRIAWISINNIEFHKKVRELYQDFQEYEDKIIVLYQVNEELEQLLDKCENWILDCYRTVPYKGLSETTLKSCVTVVVDSMLSHLQKLEYEAIDAKQFKGFLDRAVDESDNEECVLRLDQLLQEVQVIPRSEQLFSALSEWEEDLGVEEARKRQRYIMQNEEALQEIAEKCRAELRERLGNTRIHSRRLRFEIFGLSDCYAATLQSLLHGLLVIVPKLATEQEGERLLESMQSLEAQVIEAQRVTQADGEAAKKLTILMDKKQIDEGVMRELKKDLQANFKDLDNLLEETSHALKRVRLLQNRFGANKETEYLDVTINFHDLEKLKTVYHFLDTVNMVDIKRFCVSYNLKNGLLNDYFDRAYKKDVAIPKEILKQISGKTYRTFKERRHIALPLKLIILHNNPDIFDAEAQLLCHTLNLVSPDHIRKKASYLGMVKMLEQAQDGDQQILRKLGLYWGRSQSKLFNFQPQNHRPNFEGNRQALMTDVKEVVGDKLSR